MARWSVCGYRPFSWAGATKKVVPEPHFRACERRGEHSVWLRATGSKSLPCPIFGPYPNPAFRKSLQCSTVSPPPWCDFVDVKEAHSRFCLPDDRLMHLKSFLSKVTQGAGQNVIPTCYPNGREPGLPKRPDCLQ